MKFILLNIFFILSHTIVFSQTLTNSLIGSGGTISKTNNITLEWSVGEVAVNTLITDIGIITQGFHQPLLVLIKKNSLFISNSNTTNVWPNPTRDFLFVGFNNLNEKISHIELYNVNGLKIRQILIDHDDGKTSIDMQNLLPGFYYLQLTDDSGSIIDFHKIIKTN